jgi:hypothetical protein
MLQPQTIIESVHQTVVEPLRMPKRAAGRKTVVRRGMGAFRSHLNSGFGAKHSTLQTGFKRRPSEGRSMQQPNSHLGPQARIAWRIVQFVVWLVGVSIVLLLLVRPAIGLHAFWNVLIPVAPALLVVAPGLWRNICPLASCALFARHVNQSQRRRVSPAWQGRFLLFGVIALFAIVPLRHVTFDTSGTSTAIVLIALAGVAIAFGSQFEWKSGWCSGVCPVHPVERLYGTAPAISPPNAHCTSCEQCVQPCPDSTPSLTPLTARDGTARRVAGLLMVGGFPGFIWGWFQVRDYAGSEGWNHVGTAYAFPLVAAAVTLAGYLLLRPRFGTQWLGRVFATSAVACYYWYRLPMLFGFGPFPGDGMLIDLTEVLPAWAPMASRVLTTLLFAWWLVLRAPVRRSWAQRPAFATEPG